MKKICGLPLLLQYMQHLTGQATYIDSSHGATQTHSTTVTKNSRVEIENEYKFYIHVKYE